MGVRVIGGEEVEGKGEWENGTEERGGNYRYMVGMRGCALKANAFELLGKIIRVSDKKRRGRGRGRKLGARPQTSSDCAFRWKVERG
jgi:hypothetical protein